MSYNGLHQRPEPVLGWLASGVVPAETARPCSVQNERRFARNCELRAEGPRDHRLRSSPPP